MPKSTLNIQKQAKTVAERFYNNNPDPKTELIFKNNIQLAIAIALSAQTTDKKVNQVTSTLFKKYRKWEDFADADLENLREDIYGVNFHKGKADRIIKMAQKVISDFGGKFPENFEDLTSLPGFARKSANVFLNEAWGRSEGIVVDTHVTRVSTKLGLTRETTAVKIEKDLMKVVPKKHWRNFSGNCVLHGRYTCIARRPKCSECIFSDICPSVE